MFFAVGLASMPAAATASTHAAHAACVVRLGTQTLLTQDQWSRRWALPGGAAEPGEPPQQAAERQTRATTGLSVTAQSRLETLGDTDVFDCQLVGPVNLLTQDVVYVPSQAHYTTIQARFFDLESLSPEQWRYRHEAALVTGLASHATPNAPSWIHRASAPGSVLFNHEIQITRLVQAYVPQALHSFVESLSLLGTELTLCVVAILVWCICGYRRGLEFTLYLLSVSLFNCLLKQLFQLPRPFYLDPRLQLQHASSFGFPSGHTACISSIALWTGAFVLPKLRTLRAALLLCVLGCALSRVYLGVHFVHDVVGAGAESLFVWSLYKSCLRRLGQPQLPLRYWTATLLALGSVTLWVKPEPDPLVFICMSAGLLLGATLCRGPSKPMPWGYGVGLATVMAAAFVALNRYVLYYRPEEATFAGCLQIIVAGNVARGALMPVLHSLGARVWGSFDKSAPTGLPQS
jgi:membrane-associated phospholipid phosphatase/8-oxo-dGTP pyrophosphatase MutT (NUDIX family)